MGFRLLVLLTDAATDQVPEPGHCGSMSYCGAADCYPDARDMGYPFSRPFPKPITDTFLTLDNAAGRNLTIRRTSPSRLTAPQPNGHAGQVTAPTSGRGGDASQASSSPTGSHFVVAGEQHPVPWTDSWSRDPGKDAVRPRASAWTMGWRLVVIAMATTLIGCSGPSRPATADRTNPALAATTTTSRRSQPSGKVRPAPHPRPASPRLIAARAHIPVLTYHQIRNQRPTDSPAARQLITPPAVFAAHMEALDRAGYTTISGTRLVNHLLTGAPLPAKPVLVSFDDASQGQYTNALPILRRHRFVATFFVMTVVLDKPRWLSRAQLRHLDRLGMTIAAHSWDHQPVPGYHGRDWGVQLVTPAQELGRLVGHRVRLFAYPYGRWTRAAFPKLQRAGYLAAFQLAGPMDPTGPRWTVRRIMVAPTWSRATLLDRIAHSF
jgi:peptidoglycan/xylan/chitin deacetylase (PgdA/CDA1 family)